MKKNYVVNLIYVLLSCVYLKIFKKSLKNTNNALINLYIIDNGKALIFFHNLMKTKRVKKTKISSTIYKNIFFLYITTSENLIRFNMINTLHTRRTKKVFGHIFCVLT